MRWAASRWVARSPPRPGCSPARARSCRPRQPAREWTSGRIGAVAHRRKPLTVALGLNTVVLVVEVAGGIQANSLSLVTDGVHNLSDEVALGFLVLAYAMRTGLSSRLLRTANLFNSVGLLAICGLLLWRVLWRVVERIS